MPSPHYSKRIAVIVSMASGLETFVKREVEALTDRGARIHLWVTHYKASEGFGPRDDIPWTRFAPSDLITGLGKQLATHPLRWFSLITTAIRHHCLPELLLATAWSQHINPDNTDLIHSSFGDRKYFTGWFIHKLTGLPLTTAIHAHEVHAQPNPDMFRVASTDTQKFVCISETNKKLLMQNFNVPADKISVIRLPIDTHFWQPSPRRYILTVARFTPRKGWQELMEAAAQLDDSFHFLCAGWGELDIAALAEEIGISERVTVFPKLRPKELRFLMERADIFCLPSKPTPEEGSEGIPVVLMEAMAMAMPIITTSDGSITELVDETIVPPADATALANALKQVAETLPPSTSHSPDHPNRVRVQQQHSLDNFDRLLEFFKDAITRSAG